MNELVNAGDVGGGSDDRVHCKSAFGAFMLEDN